MGVLNLNLIIYHYKRKTILSEESLSVCQPITLNIFHDILKLFILFLVLQ